MFRIFFIGALIINLIACAKEKPVSVAVEPAKIVEAPKLEPVKKIVKYTKLDQNGAALPVEATAWSCVRDNETHLMWENKTDDDGLRDKNWNYTWYEIDPKKNAGFVGVTDTGISTTNLSDPKVMKKLSQSFYYANSEALYAVDPKGIDNCFDKSRCDIAKFVEDVNKSSLCGANDWRLPTLEELLTLVRKDKTNPAIDTDYFPNTVNEYYLTSEAFVDDNFYAWSIGFQFGNKYTVSKANLYTTVRLVRK